MAGFSVTAWLGLFIQGFWILGFSGLGAYFSSSSCGPPDFSLWAGQGYKGYPVFFLPDRDNPGVNPFSSCSLYLLVSYQIFWNSQGPGRGPLSGWL